MRNFFSLSHCIVFNCVKIQFVQLSVHLWTFKAFLFLCCCRSAAINILGVYTHAKVSYSGLYRKVELPDRRICTPSSLLLINTVNYCSKPYVSELLPAMCKESHLVLICVCWSLSEVGHLFTFMRCVGLSCDLPFPVLCFILFWFLGLFLIDWKDYCYIQVFVDDVPSLTCPRPTLFTTAPPPLPVAGQFWEDMFCKWSTAQERGLIRGLGTFSRR